MCKLLFLWTDHVGRAKNCCCNFVSQTSEAKKVLEFEEAWNSEYTTHFASDQCGQENVLVIANTLFQKYKRRLCTSTSPDGQHENEINYILCSQRWRSSIQSAKTRPGADCGSDHELLIAKFRLKLKKVGKPTRPFRYDLNQIPYDYTVEVRNRFKGLFW